MKKKFQVTIDGPEGANYRWLNESGVYVLSNTQTPFWVTEGELEILQRIHGDNLQIDSDDDYDE